MPFPYVREQAKKGNMGTSEAHPAVPTRAELGAKVNGTLEIDADIPIGVPDQVIRTVTENARTLKFKSPGFETE